MTTPELLRSRQLRVTAIRIAVLDALGARSHLRTDQIATAVRERIGSASEQAVYHVLSTLVGAELLRRIDLAGTVARYERWIGDGHQHLICRPCGEVVDVPCPAPADTCRAEADRHGFDLEQVELVLWGRCTSCRREDLPDHNHANRKGPRTDEREPHRRPHPDAPDR